MWLEMAWAYTRLPLFNPAWILSFSVETQVLSSLGGRPIMNASRMFAV